MKDESAYQVLERAGAGPESLLAALAGLLRVIEAEDMVDTCREG